jgi:hypothetical protein
MTPRRFGLKLTSLHAATVMVGVLVGVFHATYAAAATRNPWAIDWMAPGGATTAASAPWHVEFLPLEAPDRAAPQAMSLTAEAPQDPAAQPVSVRPKSFQYSDAYEVRRKIHVYASIATLPLFAVQAYLGQKLYNGDFTEAEHTAHQWVGASIVGLFALNTVTGLWNLHEGWGDPNRKKLRVTHGVLMLAADAGFAYAAFAAPSERSDVSTHSTHRNVAYFAVSAATAGYLIMIFGR